MLTAAVSCGIATTLSAPIGGVLFAIENTTAFYNVSNLWKCLYTSILSSIVFKIFYNIGWLEPWAPVEFRPIVLSYGYILFVILGLICGFLGSLFIRCLTMLIYSRAKLKFILISN